jgi:hypothetical protein
VFNGCLSALSGQTTKPEFVRFWTKADIGREFTVMRKKLPQRTNSDKTAHLRPHYLGCENASDRQLIWLTSAPRPQPVGTLAPLIAFCHTREAVAKSLIFYRVDA